MRYGFAAVRGVFSLLVLSMGAWVAPQSPHQPRFVLARPLPGIPSIWIDRELDGKGIAQLAARASGLQGRVLWVDCTANIDRYNTADKIASLVRKVREVGFNTIVFDVKPISGQVVYPSQLAPKLRAWKGKELPADFDPLGAMVREARANGLSLLISLNAFSEGHRDFRVGPGYETPELQTVLYEPQPMARIDTGAAVHRFPISEAANPPQLIPESLHVFNDSSRRPQPTPGNFAVTIDRNFRIVDGFESGGFGSALPTIPRGGSLLAGNGPAGEFLRQHALPGRKLEIVADPVFVPISARPRQQVPLMMNPTHPKVVERALAVLGEVVANYDVDGVLYDDRLRYAGMNADFSEPTRAEFEQEVGRRLTWPNDVFRYTFTPDFRRGIRPGPYYQRWLEWRAEKLTEYVRAARTIVKLKRPQVVFGVYAGSWYGEYAGIGSNYAAPSFEGGFWFATSEYRKSGFADSLDLLITGCYYPTSTVFEAMETDVPIGHSVEYAGYLSNQIAGDRAWTYAGIMLMQYPADPQAFGRALSAACASTQGVMVFDLSHDIDRYWDVMAAAFRVPARAPHMNPQELSRIRSRRAEEEAKGRLPGPLVVAAGAPGTGQ
ncbi:MAG: family 10 glycosylhydrolase [Fimbriimonadaceae bacterium]|nr:family 10 glycosylhydrolase [Fimbriimonadaceae bacterium]